MMAAATVCVAAGLQAAQFNWSFEADDAMGSYTVADSATYYIVSGASGVGNTLATILKDQGASAFTTALASYSYATGTLSSGTASGTLLNVTEDYAAMLIINDGLTDNANFAYSEYDASANIFDPPASKATLQTYASDYGDPDYASSWGAGSVKGESVPEPTSGLLLLLGVAGLALRRKQA